MRPFAFLFLFLLSTAGAAYGQTAPRPLHERPIISVTGRLATEKHGETDWLILHAKTGDTYLITGGLAETLKKSLLQLGDKNYVFLTGNQDGRSTVSCDQSSEYEYNRKGNRALKIDAKCIRYYNLEVTQILFAKKSEETMPPPKRDAEEEAKLIKQAQRKFTVPIAGEIYGKVSAVNLKSPVKTVDVENRDKNSPIQKITVLIDSQTRIAKSRGKEEPMFLSIEAVHPGQEVTVVYMHEEIKNRAMFITITKDTD